MSRKHPDYRPTKLVRIMKSHTSWDESVYGMMILREHLIQCLNFTIRGNHWGIILLHTTGNLLSITVRVWDFTLPVKKLACKFHECKWTQDSGSEIEGFINHSNNTGHSISFCTTPMSPISTGKIKGLGDACS